MNAHLKPYSIAQAHADDRHAGDPWFATICAQCRKEWVAEVKTYLLAYTGEGVDLNTMTEEEYGDAFEAHRDAGEELKALRAAWSIDLYARMIAAANLSIRADRMAGVLFS